MNLKHHNYFFKLRQKIFIYKNNVNKYINIQLKLLLSIIFPCVGHEHNSFYSTMSSGNGMWQSREELPQILFEIAKSKTTFVV